MRKGEGEYRLFGGEVELLVLEGGTSWLVETKYFNGLSQPPAVVL